jgi:hypothetical protein
LAVVFVAGCGTAKPVGPKVVQNGGAQAGLSREIGHDSQGRLSRFTASLRQPRPQTHHVFEATLQVLVVRNDQTKDEHRKTLRVVLDMSRLQGAGASLASSCSDTRLIVNGKRQQVESAQRLTNGKVGHLRCTTHEHKAALYLTSLLASADSLRYRACGAEVRASKKELALLRQGAREVLGQFQALYIPVLGGPGLPVKIPQ